MKLEAVTSPRRVLVVKTSSLGDVIHTLPALNDAIEALPGICFDWVVEEGFAEIPAWHPAVEQVLPVAIRRWRKNVLHTWRSGEWRNFKKKLQRTSYDAVIDAQGLLKSAWVAAKARGPRYGLDAESAREPLSSRFYQYPQAVVKGQHAVERVRQLFAQSLDYPLPQSTGRFGLDRNGFKDKQQLRPQQPYVMFVHGTTWATKHWPEAYWEGLCKKVNDAGFRVVLPWGNEVERIRAEKIAASGINTQVLPRLNLYGVAAMIAGATAVVAVDTGLGHLSSALEVPGVSLYGPTSPKLVGAYGSNQRHLTLEGLATVTADVEPALFAPMTPELVWQALAPQLDTGTEILRQLASKH